MWPVISLILDRVIVNLIKVRINIQSVTNRVYFDKNDTWTKTLKTVIHYMYSFCSDLQFAQVDRFHRITHSVCKIYRTYSTPLKEYEGKRLLSYALVPFYPFPIPYPSSLHLAYPKQSLE